MSESSSPLPSFYLSLQQVRESELLSPERMAELEAEIERRLTKPRNAWGKVIETARLADLSPYGEWLYPQMEHEMGEPWRYVKNQILRAILTEEEREVLKKHAFVASCAARDQARFAKAKHVPEVEWKEGVYYGDTYYPSIEEFKEYWESNGDPDCPYPEYLWAARRQVVIQSLYVSDVVESQIDAWGWEGMEVKDLNGVNELRAALNAFVEANKDVVSYIEDTSIAIILEQPTLNPTSPISL